MIRKMRLGTIQGGVFSNMGLAKIDHSLMVLSIPFLFHTRDEFNAVFDRMKPAFEKTIEDKGYKMMLWTLAGWVNFFSKSKVVDPGRPEEAQGQRDRGLPGARTGLEEDGLRGRHVGDANDLMIQLQSGAVVGRLPAAPSGRLRASPSPSSPTCSAPPWPRSSAGSS